jgi:hypothetical protein
MNLIERIEATNRFIEDKKPTQSNWGEDIIFDFDYDLLPEATTIKTVYESEVDEHGWYGLQDIVFKLCLDDDVEYVKTTLATRSYSEYRGLGDINHRYPKFKIVHPKTIETVVYE